jgi:CheY-like chemotaxis protein
MSKILVIDDDPEVRTLLKKQLASAGYEVTTAQHGLEALVCLETLKPDVILCDVSMPELDGFEFVDAIKKLDETRKVPIIFITANSDPTSMIKGINLGARFYVTKPFDIDDVLGKIKRVLAAKK